MNLFTFLLLSVRKKTTSVAYAPTVEYALSSFHVMLPCVAAYVYLLSSQKTRVRAPSSRNHMLPRSMTVALQTHMHTTRTHARAHSTTSHPTLLSVKRVKAAHTRLPSVGFRSRSRFLAVNLQVTWVINPPTVTLKMHDLKMTDKDKLLANCEHNYGVWKMQEYKSSWVQPTSKKLYAIHFKVAQTWVVLDLKMTDKENYGSSRIRLIYWSLLLLILLNNNENTVGHMCMYILRIR